MPIRVVLFFLLAAIHTVPSSAADAVHGGELVDKNCYSCHGNEIYTRQDRRVQSLDGLHKQVRRCELALGLRWFDSDIEDASLYLNENFYKFK